MSRPHCHRGFANLSPEVRHVLARQGGIKAHQGGGAHEWTVKEAREAGRKGGQAQVRKRLERLAVERLAQAKQAAIAHQLDAVAGFVGGRTGD